jgi:hypothetical protein
MTASVIQVLVGFETQASFGTPFQLNDVFYGVTDTAGRGTLAGIAFADLTTLVQSVNINRGRSRQLQEFNAGTATVAFWNKSRDLDPLNSASPYWNVDANMTGVVPRLPIIIKANGIPIYTGLVTDWNVDYDLANNDMVFATCADQFTVLASNTLLAHTTAEEYSSNRIATVLDYSEVSYAGARAIGTGSSLLGGTAANAAFSIQDGTALLNYLQTVTTSEQGYLYMSADGTLTFKGRNQVLTAVSGATFNGGVSDIRYQTLTNEFGDELLYNYILTESPAGPQQVATDAASVNQYQTQTYSQTSLLNATVTEVADIGQYLLGKYKQPVLRFTGLSTQMLALTEAQQNISFNLDLTSIATVIKTFVAGAPTTVSQTLIVSGISHNITPGSHIVTYTFESTDGNQFFTFDSLIFGTFDNNLLGF